MFKVSSKTNSKSLAGAIASAIREKGVVEIQAIGAGAVNQVIKAVAIARGYMAPSGIDLICIPVFSEVEIDGQSRTALKFVIRGR